MMRRTISCILPLAALATAAVSASADDARPNVVLIVADDLGWADLGCYGSRFHRTPNLDRLAAEGRRFVQAYAACPVCSPSRAALMTGKHPVRLNLTDWLPGRPDRPSQKLLRPPFRQQLPLEEVTLAEALKAAGYATGHIGKWHLGGAGFEPTRQGFDLNIAGDDRGTTLSYFAPFARQGRTMPGLADAPEGQYLTDRLASEAERFIDGHRSGPFFLHAPHFAVHTPIVAKPELVEHYPKWDGTPHGRQEDPVYAAMIESLDEGVGRIVAKLDGLGLASRTVVIFTSDNGGVATSVDPTFTPPTINAPLREGKGWLYEGGVRVPLIVRWPGRIAPGVEETPAWGADLFPTVKALCGLADARDADLDGESLARLLTEGAPIAPARSTGITRITAPRGAGPPARSATASGSWSSPTRRAAGSCSTWGATRRSPPTSPTSSPNGPAGSPRSWRRGGSPSPPRCPRPTPTTRPTRRAMTARSRSRPARPRSTARGSATSLCRTRTRSASGPAPATGPRGSSSSAARASSPSRRSSGAARGAAAAPSRSSWTIGRSRSSCPRRAASRSSCRGAWAACRSTARGATASKSAPHPSPARP